jgi:hypothetical protein
MRRGGFTALNDSVDCEDADATEGTLPVLRVCSWISLRWPQGLGGLPPRGLVLGQSSRPQTAAFLRFGRC